MVAARTWSASSEEGDEDAARASSDGGVGGAASAKGNCGDKDAACASSNSGKRGAERPKSDCGDEYAGMAATEAPSARRNMGRKPASITISRSTRRARLMSREKRPRR